MGFLLFLRITVYTSKYVIILFFLAIDRALLSIRFKRCPVIVFSYLSSFSHLRLFMSLLSFVSLLSWLTLLPEPFLVCFLFALFVLFL